MYILIFAGMGKWMDLEKNKVVVGDIVCYIETNEVVTNEDGNPLIVIDIKYNRVVGSLCVFYNNGAFDYYSQVKKCPKLIMELL